MCVYNKNIKEIKYDVEELYDGKNIKELDDCKNIKELDDKNEELLNYLKTLIGVRKEQYNSKKEYNKFIGDKCKL